VSKTVFGDLHVQRIDGLPIKLSETTRDQIRGSKLSEEEQATLTRLIENISIHPSDVQIADVREPKGKITGSKLVFLDYDLGIVVKMGKAGGDVWREIHAYQSLNKDPQLSHLKEYAPSFLGYVCNTDVDAFALEDLKKKGYIEFYDLFHAPSITNRFKEMQRQAIGALSVIHQKTISSCAPDIADIYIDSRFMDSVTKANHRVLEHAKEPEFKTLHKFLESEEMLINGEKTPGLRRLLRTVVRNLKLLRPTHSVFRHGDFHFKNILVRDDSIKLIDWVNSGKRQDAVYDLGKYIHFPLQFYPLQLFQDVEIGLKIDDLQLQSNPNLRPPEITYDIEAFVPRGVRELIRDIPNYHFLFSDENTDRNAPGRILLAVSASTIGGIKYLPAELSLICLGESLKTLRSLNEVLATRSTYDLDVCLEALLKQHRR
jgi:hypothetical protein